MIGWRVVLAHARYQVGRHGWPALLGVALLVAAGAGYPLVVGGIESRAADAREELAALKQKLANRPERQQNDAAERARSFYAQLPPASGAEQAVKTIHEAARDKGVSIHQGEYRMTREGSGPLIRYQLTLPVRGTYPQFRTWLGAVMNGLPSLALEEMNLKRDDAAQGEIVARVRLTLFLRAS